MTRTTDYTDYLEAENARKERKRDEQIGELLDQLRRVEMRMTRFMENQRFDMQTETPVWKNGAIAVPSVACSLQDIIEVIPNTWTPRSETEGIEVWHEGRQICYIALPEDGRRHHTVASSGTSAFASGVALRAATA